MYLPTILMVISTLVSYLQTFKALSENVSLMTENATIKSLVKELKETQDMMKVINQDNTELKRTQKELINEVSKVVKYEDVSTNKKV